jgi:glycosyltransferase involved in cell wall biosynthesis
MELAARRPGLYGLVIGGHGEPDREYHDRIRSEAGSSEAGRRLLFLGYRPDLDDLYRVMDVFVHASIRPEPFGMVILEAMFNRVPVVATGIGGPVEILENGNCGILVTPGSVGEITEGVEKYLDDPHFTECTVQKAYDRVIGLFNVGRTVTCTQELFLHVMDGDHGRRSMPIQTERRSYEDRQIDERLHC